MAKKDTRFDVQPVESQGAGLTSVIVDTETGVHYLLAISPNLVSGLTVLVDQEGKPLVK